MEIVAALLHRRIVLRGPVKQQELGRHGERVELGLEAGQDHPQDRQEDQKSEQPRRTRRHPHASRTYLACHRYASRFRPMIRTRKKATILAITTATNPPAEALPTSNWISACE